MKTYKYKFEDLTRDEFIGFMNEQGYFAVKVVEDQWYALLKLLFTTAIIQGNTRDYISGYDNRWCYHTNEDAIFAYADWCDKKFKGEPCGWHRNPPTGRRRMNGDETKEYIEY